MNKGMSLAVVAAIAVSCGTGEQNTAQDSDLFFLFESKRTKCRRWGDNFQKNLEKNKDRTTYCSAPQTKPQLEQQFEQQFSKDCGSAVGLAALSFTKKVKKGACASVRNTISNGCAKPEEARDAFLTQCLRLAEGGTCVYKSKKAGNACSKRTGLAACNKRQVDGKTQECRYQDSSVCGKAAWINKKISWTNFVNRLTSESLDGDPEGLYRYAKKLERLRLHAERTGYRICKPKRTSTGYDCGEWEEFRENIDSFCKRFCENEKMFVVNNLPDNEFYKEYEDIKNSVYQVSDSVTFMDVFVSLYRAYKSARKEKNENGKRDAAENIESLVFSDFVSILKEKSNKSKTDEKVLKFIKEWEKSYHTGLIFCPDKYQIYRKREKMEPKLDVYSDIVGFATVKFKTFPQSTRIPAGGLELCNTKKCEIAENPCRHLDEKTCTDGEKRNFCEWQEDL